MNRWLFLLLLLCGAVSMASAQQYITENGHVVFRSDAPLRDFEGVSEKLQGLIDFEKNMLDFYLDLNTLDTGVKLRDKHMRDNYLETKKFPFAEFTGTLQALPPFDALQEGKQTAVTAVGTFKIHGVAREIRVPGTLRLENNELLLNATFKVLLTDYDIRKPSLLGYELADEQEVLIRARFKRSSSDKNP